MCLIIDKKFHKKRVNGIVQPFIAKQDIYCLKMIEEYDEIKKFGKSYYRYVVQSAGTLMKSNLGIHDSLVPFLNKKIEEGLHAVRIGEHFNGSITISCTIMLAKIPEGSKYYIGIDNDIVSNQMILVEPLVSNTDNISSLKVFLGEPIYDSKEIFGIANKILEDEGYEMPEYK